MVTCTAGQLESDVFDLEGIRIVVRVPASTPVGRYLYRNPAPNKMTVSDWLSRRIIGLLGDAEVSVLRHGVLDPHPLVTLGALRAPYLNKEY